MAEPADINVDELRRRARRRLVGAVVLALGVAVVVPMLLETEQKPLGEDVSVKIPPIDDGKFVNRLSESRAKDTAQPAPPDETAKAGSANTPSQTANAPSERMSKYDTRVPESAGAVGATASSNNDKSSGVKPAEPRAPEAKTDAAASLPPAAAATETSKPAVANAPAASAKMQPAAHDGFAVQLAAFADDKGANALAGRLKKAGYAAYTEPLKTSKGTLWRVRVGPYSSRDAAIAAREKLKTEGQSGIVAAVK